MAMITEINGEIIVVETMIIVGEIVLITAKQTGKNYRALSALIPR